MTLGNLLSFSFLTSRMRVMRLTHSVPLRIISCSLTEKFSRLTVTPSMKFCAPLRLYLYYILYVGGWACQIELPTISLYRWKHHIIYQETFFVLRRM